MKIRLKDGTEYNVTSINKNIDHNSFFNNKLNNTNVILNVNENEGITAVSYTHLDVYKRQDYDTESGCLRTG